MQSQTRIQVYTSKEAASPDLEQGCLCTVQGGGSRIRVYGRKETMVGPETNAQFQVTGIKNIPTLTRSQVEWIVQTEALLGLPCEGLPELQL